MFDVRRETDEHYRELSFALFLSVRSIVLLSLDVYLVSYVLKIEERSNLG